MTGAGAPEQEPLPTVEMDRSDQPRRWPTTDALDEIGPDDDYQRLSPDAPLLLLPVRLETKLDKDTLRIRIHPEQLNVDQDDERLSVAERAAGDHFWRTGTGKGDEQRLAAWRQLVDLVGSRRAPHVADRTDPDRSRHPLPGDLEPRPETKVAGQRLSLLPSRWVAMGFHLDHLVFFETSEPVDVPFELGIVGQDRPSLDDDLGPELAWLFDYEEAERRGMAITVALSPSDIARGELTSLVAFGVDAGPRGGDPRAAAISRANWMAEILAGHERSVGLGFLPPGTPTNNTGDERTPWRGDQRDDAGQLARFDRPAIDDGSDAQVLRSALGLPPGGVLDRCPHGDEPGAADRRHMNTVLFDTTIGTFARRLFPLRDSPPSDEQLRDLRRWFIDRVSGSGPLPTLRVGRQPYGVLPVAPLPPEGARLETARTIDQRVAAVTSALRPFWEWSLDLVPSLDPNAIDRVAGVARPTSDVPAILASSPNPARMFRRRHFDRRDDLVSGYQQMLARLRGRNPDLFQLYESANASFGPSGSVIDEIARWAHLHRRVDAHPTQSAGWRADSHHQIDSALAVLGQIEQRQRPLSLLDPPGFHGAPQTGVSALLEALPSSARLELTDTPLVAPRSGQGTGETDRGATVAPGEWLRALAARAGAKVESPELPPELLDRPPILYQLIEATIVNGPKEHRPEVATSLLHLATRPATTLDRLAREALGLGANRLDAWITSLATRQLELRRQKGELPVGLSIGAYGFVSDLPLVVERPSGGFIHAPSLAHAATAGILRSAWLAHGTSQDRSPAAVSLSSRRIRHALDVIDGVRLGHDLGTLLGQRLARAIHDNGLSGHIRDLRARVAAAGTDVVTLDEPVDGLAALELDRRTELGGLATTLRAELDGLAQVLDAVHDLALFEGAHAASEGRFAHASAVFESMNQGTQRPPEFRSARTGRISVAVQHRLLLVGAEPTGPTDGWVGGYRDRLAPGIESWLRSMLPPADGVSFQVAGQRHDLGQLALSALDAVYLAADDPTTLSPALATLIDAEVGAGAVEVESSESSSGVSLEEFQLLAVELRRVLETATPAHPGSFTAGEGDDPTITTLDKALGELVEELTHLAATADTPSGRRGLARFGIVGQPDLLARRATTIADAVGSSNDAIAGRSAALFGRSVPVAPLFDVAQGSDTILPDEALADGAAISGWIRDMGRVRPSLVPLANARFLASTLELEPPSPVAGQVGGATSWIATTRPSSEATAHVSVVVLPADRAPMAGAQVSGVVVDSWADHVPLDERVTGVAVQIDAPSTRAPQACLLAVLPVDHKAWRLRTVAQTILDTMQTAALRMVQPEDLADLGGIVPTLYVDGEIDSWRPSPQ